MRFKIIAVCSVIVAIVGLASFVAMRLLLGDTVANPARARAEADRATTAAVSLLQVEALTMQRWLSEQANDPKAREPFHREKDSVRSDAATAYANDCIGRARQEFPTATPTLVAMIDASGIALGRDGSTLMRGDDMGKVHPALLDAIQHGRTGSDAWFSKARNEQMLVSFATVRDHDGKAIGALLLGTAISDGRLSGIADATSGRGIAIIAEHDGKGELVAKSSGMNAEAIAAAQTLQVQPSDRVAALQGAPASFAASALGLRGYGDGKRAVVVAFAPISIVDSVWTLLWPILGMMGLGFAISVFAGTMLGKYIEAPIVQIEETLLAVINGQTDKRIELEHDELGGLVFRINTLLNSLLGVPEDDTDAEGRPSRPPSKEDFREAIAVDQSVALKHEPADAYYRRLFDEYIAAKRQVGDPVDHITMDAFVTKMQASENETAQQQGKPVRFRVELQGREVKLIAVTLD